jgi:hypothetical protein
MTGRRLASWLQSGGADPLAALSTYHQEPQAAGGAGVGSNTQGGPAASKSRHR